jgi:hypothetical protein
MSSIDMQTYQKETADLINVTDKSGRISLRGSISEKKQQLLKKLGMVNEQFSGRKKEH